MASSTPFLYLVLVIRLSLFHLASSTNGPLERTAKPGQNFTLNCQVGEEVTIVDVTVVVVEWTRTDLESPQYVYLQRDGHSDTTHQHPTFTGRVELEDRQMTDGNLDLILKNVTSNDSGTYECRFFSPGGRRVNKRAIIKTEPSSIINLKIQEIQEIKESDANNRQRVGLGLGLGVLGVIVVGVIVKRNRTRRHNDRNSDVTAAEEVEMCV